MERFEIKVNDGNCKIYTPYNKDFIAKLKLLGGRWDASASCWTISQRCIEEVREAMREVYGRDDQPVTDMVDVKLTFEESVTADRASVVILGRTVASAYGRDSGARVGDGVMFLQGKPKSGGSVKNWETIVPSGCVVKLLDVPKGLIERADLPDGVTLEIVGQNVDVQSLKDELTRLTARIKEIRRQLDAIGESYES